MTARSRPDDIRFMDDILVLAPTRWKLRRAVRLVNEILGALRLEKHPDKTVIGFDFLGYQFSREGLGLAKATIQRFVERAARLYEQGRGQPKGGGYLADPARYKTVCPIRESRHRAGTALPLSPLIGAFFLDDLDRRMTATALFYKRLLSARGVCPTVGRLGKRWVVEPPNGPRHKALTLVLARVLPVSPRCTHINGNGGAKAAVREVRAALATNTSVTRALLPPKVRCRFVGAPYLATEEGRYCPHSCRSQEGSGPAQLGGFLPFAGTRSTGSSACCSRGRLAGPSSTR
jgi:hypothetical protein